MWQAFVVLSFLGMSAVAQASHNKKLAKEEPKCDCKCPVPAAPVVAVPKVEAPKEDKK